MKRKYDKNKSKNTLIIVEQRGINFDKGCA